MAARRAVGEFSITNATWQVPDDTQLSLALSSPAARGHGWKVCSSGMATICAMGCLEPVCERLWPAQDFHAGCVWARRHDRTWGGRTHRRPGPRALGASLQGPMRATPSALRNVPSPRPASGTRTRSCCSLKHWPKLLKSKIPK